MTEGSIFKLWREPAPFHEALRYAKSCYVDPSQTLVWEDWQAEKSEELICDGYHLPIWVRSKTDWRIASINPYYEKSYKLFKRMGKLFNRMFPDLPIEDFSYVSWISKKKHEAQVRRFFITYQKQKNRDLIEANRKAAILRLIARRREAAKKRRKIYLLTHNYVVK